jgi:hypothetical protein
VTTAPAKPHGVATRSFRGGVRAYFASNVIPARVSPLIGDRSDRSALRQLFDSGHDRFRSPRPRRKPRTCENYLPKNSLKVSRRLGRRFVGARIDARLSSR